MSRCSSSTVKRSTCVMRNSSVRWLRACSAGTIRWSGCERSPGWKMTAKSKRDVKENRRSQRDGSGRGEGGRPRASSKARRKGTDWWPSSSSCPTSSQTRSTGRGRTAEGTWTPRARSSARAKQRERTRAEKEEKKEKEGTDLLGTGRLSMRVVYLWMAASSSNGWRAARASGSVSLPSRRKKGRVDKGKGKEDRAYRTCPGTGGHRVKEGERQVQPPERQSAGDGKGRRKGEGNARFV